MKRVWIIYFFLFSALFIVGCSGNTEQPIGLQNSPQVSDVPISLALKFNVGDVVTYRVITENHRQAQWEGPPGTRPENFIGGSTSQRAEVTFSQTVTSISDTGNAVLEIQIIDVKYQSVVRDNIILEFDSSEQNSVDRPLATLIGSTYTIEMTPFGHVVKINDTSSIEAKFKSSASENNTALTLISSQSIKNRHTVAALAAAAGKSEFYTGDSWTATETISYDLMGTKTFEKEYTLEDVVDEPAGEKTAIVQMNAVSLSSSQMLTLVSDYNEAYTGLLKMDLTRSTLTQNREEIASEWVVQDSETTDAVMRINANRIYDLEIIEQ